MDITRPASIPTLSTWSRRRAMHTRTGHRARLKRARSARKPVVLALARLLLFAVWARKVSLAPDIAM